MSGAYPEEPSAGLEDPSDPAGGLTPRLLVRALLTLLALALLLAWGRAAVESRRYFQWGEQADAEQDWESAVLHYRHALQWHAPAFSKSAAAYDALVAIGDRHAEQHDAEAALVAYRSARWGVMAIQHIGAPLTQDLPALHLKIGSLMAAQGPEAERAERATRYTAQLEAWRTRRPNPAYGAAASLGFLAWIVALFSLAWRGFWPDGTIDRPRFTKHLVLVALTLITWLVCLARA